MVPLVCFFTYVCYLSIIEFNSLDEYCRCDTDYDTRDRSRNEQKGQVVDNHICAEHKGCRGYLTYVVHHAARNAYGDLF